MRPEVPGQARAQQELVLAPEVQVVVPVLRRHSCKAWARVPVLTLLGEVLGPLAVVLAAERALVRRGVAQGQGLAAAKAAGH